MASLLHFLSVPHHKLIVFNEQDKIAADMLDPIITCKLLLPFFRLIANHLGNK